MCETPNVMSYTTSGPHWIRETPSVLIYNISGPHERCETLHVVLYNTSLCEIAHGVTTHHPRPFPNPSPTTCIRLPPPRAQILALRAETIHDRNPLIIGIEISKSRHVIPLWGTGFTNACGRSTGVPRDRRENKICAQFWKNTCFVQCSRATLKTETCH